MKIIVAMDEVPICVSRMNPDAAIRKHISSPLKKVPHADRASKIQIEFGDSKGGELQLFAKPHFMAPDMLDYSDFCFVGAPGLYSHRGFDDEECRRIEASMMKYRCYPVFQKVTAYARVIEKILKKHTYEFVQKELDHARMFERYMEYNKKYYEKIMDIYEDGDVVWVMSHNLLLLPGMMRDVPVGMSFSIPFSSLFRCIPFWEQLLLSVLCCKYIEFDGEFSRASFDLLVSQKMGFLAGNPEYRSMSIPVIEVGTRGVDKDAITQVLSSEEFMEIDLRRGKVILLPSDSQTHLLGVEAYLSKYDEEVTILFLYSGTSDLSGQTEVLRLKEYLEMNHRVLTRAFLPTNDFEFFSVVRSCDICHCPEVADVCLFLGIPVVQSNPYDFYDVADEINKKIGRRSDVICSGGPLSRTEWMVRFLTNFLRASGVERAVGLKPKEARVRQEIRMCEEGHEEVKAKRRPEIKKEISRKNVVLVDPDDEKDVTISMIVEDFRRNKNRTLILDYDGTLTDIVAHPSMAMPTQEIKDLLVGLNRRCRTVICTGRGVEDADKFFPMEVEVFAEHGACHRINGKWREEGSSFPQKDLAWRIIEFFIQRTPGSEAEEKRTGYAFHYRNVSPLIAVKQAKALFELLRWACGDHVKEGNHLVEVRSSKKSLALEGVEDGFILCAGDDVADEEMFEICKGYTVKISALEQSTSASYRIKDPRSFRKLLWKLAE